MRPAGRVVQGLVVAQLWCAATYLELALRRQPFPDLAARWSAAATSRIGRGLPLAAGLLETDRLYRLATLASRWWRQDRGCLSRALLAWWIELARDGEAAIVIGVRRDRRAPFAAHAWVEVGGQVRGEALDPTACFRELVRYGPCSASGARP